MCIMVITETQQGNKTVTLPTPQALGDEFVTLLSHWLSDYEIGEIQRLNATPAYANTGSCASHNFCDSNEALLFAFEVLAECELDLEIQEHLDLCNAAWDYARTTYLTATVI